MSILIKGMEMPKKGHILSIVIQDGKVIGSNSRKVLSKDVIEVPKHGRLIDADAISEDDRQVYGFYNNYDLQQLLDNCPTIIEAETCNNSENTCNKTEDDAVNTSFPCDTCKFNPPSSCDGKPCTMCDTSNPLTNCYQKAEGEDE